MGTPSAVLRRERARRAVGRLRAQVDGWLVTWDGRREQTSQLARVRATLTKLIDRLEGRARAIAADAFADARKLDADLAVTERLWRYLADRLDQRRDPRLQPTLELADDVVWACTIEARALAGAKAAPTLPVPLAFVEPSFTPTAIPRTEAPIAPRSTCAEAAASIADDGSIVVGNAVGEVWRFDAEGRGTLVFATMSTILTTPVTRRDGVILSGAEDGHLRALRPNGDLLWSFDAGGAITTSASL